MRSRAYASGSAIQCFKQVLSCPSHRGLRLHRLEQLAQGGAAEIGHAKGPEPAGRIVPDGVKRHNMSVLQPRQRQVFVGLAGRLFVSCGQLENNGAVAERKLAGQKDPAVGAAAELGEQQKIVQDFSGSGELRFAAARAQETLKVEQYFQLWPPLREAAQHLLHRHFQAVLLAQANLFVNQFGGRCRVLPKFRVPRQEILRHEALAAPPALDHFSYQPGCQSFCVGLGQRRRARQIR